MKATAFEFRFRFWIIVAIYVLGFTTPWDAVWHLDGSGPNAHVWGWLAVGLSRGGALRIGTAFSAVLVAAIVCAAAGAWLRVWGTATLGANVMSDEQMRGDQAVVTGPYRYLRNPLYVGSWLNMAALAMLMRPSGAVFTLVALIGFQMRLILGEEAFLREKLGQAYVEYCARVGRIVPRLWAKAPDPTHDDGTVMNGAPRKPRWGQAMVAEVYMWMSAGAFAVFGWQYDAELLIRCVLVSLGVSLVMRGVRMGVLREA